MSESLDEFLDGGFENYSDNSLEDHDEVKPTRKRKRKSSKESKKKRGKSHKSEASEKAEKAKDVVMEDMESDSDMSDTEEFGIPMSIGHEENIVTDQFLNDLHERAIVKHQFKAIAQLVSVFHAACVTGEDEKDRPSHRIPSGKLFNRVVKMSLLEITDGFNGFLDVKSDIDGGQNSFLPCKSPRWKKLENVVKMHLNNVLKFLGGLSDEAMIVFILEQILTKITPFFVSFQKLAAKFLKAALGIWSGSLEEAKVIAAQCLKKLAIQMPYPFIDLVLKGLYQTFVRNARFVSRHSINHIEFMSDTIVEVYGIDSVASYQHAFTYIRQLAIHLRNSLQVKTKESYRNVYNWSLINALRVWGKVLSEMAGDKEMVPLIYPYVQVVVGVIRLVPTVRYYPLRFHCVEFLNNLSLKSGFLIPVAPYLLEVISAEWANKKPSKSGIKKQMDIDLMLKVTKNEAECRMFRDVAFEKAILLLTESLTLRSGSNAFPDLVVPSVVSLRRFVKKCKNPKYSNAALLLAKKIEAGASQVSAQRDSESFNPSKMIKDAITFAAVTPNQLMAQHSSSLRKAYQAQIEKMRAESRDIEDVDEDEGILFAEEMGGNVASASTPEESEDTTKNAPPPQPTKHSKKKPKTPKPKKLKTETPKKHTTEKPKTGSKSKLSRKKPHKQHSDTLTEFTISDI